MNYQQLPRSFFVRDTHEVARDLLGKLLVRRWRGKELVGHITEVEAYVGEDDAACHAAKGRTKRTEVLYGEAGHGYVYLIYGMYYMFNVVTEQYGFPAAVLVRAVQPLADELGRMNYVLGKTDGPGKLTRELHIARAQNYEDLTTSEKLFVSDDGYRVRPKDIITTPRIGVDYAGEDALLPWRYLYERGDGSPLS